LATEIKSEARRLGFDLCRVASAAPPASGPAFDAWLEAGYHGEMTYLARNAAKRRDPQRVLPGARSVVVFAASYHHEAAPPSTARHGGAGTVARYARFTDYHEVLAARLRELAAFLDRRGGAGA
jgi:epoxyqueuosine reductase